MKLFLFVYIITQEVVDCIKNRGFSKFNENQILFEVNFWNFCHLKTFLGLMFGPSQNLGPIGSAVLTLIWYKHKGIQTDRQSLYVDLNFNNSSETQIFAIFLFRLCNLMAPLILILCKALERTLETINILITINTLQRNWVLATNSDLLIPTSLKSDVRRRHR